MGRPLTKRHRRSLAIVRTDSRSVGHQLRASAVQALNIAGRLRRHQDDLHTAAERSHLFTLSRNYLRIARHQRAGDVLP